MPECKAFECILGVHFECISILSPLLLLPNIRQPMKSHLAKTPKHLLGLSTTTPRHDYVRNAFDAPKIIIMIDLFVDIMTKIEADDEECWRSLKVSFHYFIFVFHKAHSHYYFLHSIVVVKYKHSSISGRSPTGVMKKIISFCSKLGWFP